MTEGVVVVVRRGPRFLVIRRSAKVVAPGAWCFVGGAIHGGESQEQAVVREFREEVGAAVRPLRCIWRYRSPAGDLRLFWWLAELADEPFDLNPAEVAEVRWCAVEELLALPELLESNREFLRVIGRHLGDIRA